MQSLLITGGCGFVGASLALLFRDRYPALPITCLDNLKRRGSELNISRLQDVSINFVHGDIRNKEDLLSLGSFDTLLECSAEPSVLAGYGGDPAYLVDTNLRGTLNCLEYARLHQATFLFLSTSRVYPFGPIINLPYTATDTRLVPHLEKPIPGVSAAGFSEELALSGPRSLYGATKLASELIIQEYADMYGLKAIINRCGVLTGPWQFGKVDQGVVVLWMARHYWKRPLSYIGYGGEGKQVRDMLHVADLFALLLLQLHDLDQHSGEIYNVGGGLANSASLCELTELCRAITGNTIPIAPVLENRNADIPYYVTNNDKVRSHFGWEPARSVEDILREIYVWIKLNETVLQRILA